jgi:hypothetical protein
MVWQWFTNPMRQNRSDLNEFYSVPEPNSAMYIPAYRQFSEPDLTDFTLQS